VPQAEKFIACPTAVSAVRLISAATSATFILAFRIFTPFPTCSCCGTAHVLVGANDAKRALSAGLRWRQADATGGWHPAKRMLAYLTCRGTATDSLDESTTGG
jgi:hypothetical protein